MIAAEYGSTDFNMEVTESQNSRDARIEQLWFKLDPQKRGELDLHGLQKGLRRLDHRKHFPLAALNQI